jgi:hypothetical protein
VDMARAGTVEEDGLFTGGQPVAHLDADGIAGLYRAAVGYLLIDVDVQFFQRNGFRLRDRGEGQDDSTAQCGDDELTGATVLAAVFGRGFHREAPTVDLDLGISTGQANGNRGLGHGGKFPYFQVYSSGKTGVTL